MSKHRSAVDAVKADELATTEATTRQALDEHQAACYACRPGKDFTKRACDRGYALFKTYWAAAAEHRGWKHGSGLGAADEQLTLW